MFTHGKEGPKECIHSILQRYYVRTKTSFAKTGTSTRRCRYANKMIKIEIVDIRLWVIFFILINLLNIYRTDS